MDEEIEFRKWLATLNQQPAEVEQDDQWNRVVLEETIDYVFGKDA